MFYTVSRFILFLLFKIFFRLKVFGRENFPKSGSVIVAPNHASFLDPMIVGVAAPRKLNYLARDTLFKHRVFAKILYRVHVWPIKRESGDISAFRTALARLSQAKPLLIFPEGTRSKDGKLQGPRPGIGFLQTASKSVILPCYVKGSMKAWPRHLKFPMPMPVSVYFGKPMSFKPEESSKPKKERYAEISGQVMEAIKELEQNAD